MDSGKGPSSQVDSVGSFTATTTHWLWDLSDSFYLSRPPISQLKVELIIVTASQVLQKLYKTDHAKFSARCLGYNKS